MEDDQNRNRSRNNFPHVRRTRDTAHNWRQSVGEGAVSSDNGNASSNSTHFNDRKNENFLRSSASNIRSGSRFRAPESTEGNKYASRAKHFGRPGRSMGLMFFEDLLKNDPEKMMLVLVKEREGFSRLLEQDLSCDLIVLIVKILSKICSSAFNETKYSILHSTFNEKLDKKLSTFIACLPMQDKFQRRTSANFWNDPDQFWTNLIEICEHLLYTTPTFAYKTLPTILNSLKMYIPLIEQHHDIQVPEDLKKRVEKMLEMIKIHISEKEETKKSTQQQPAEETTEPPDDFRQISVYPTPEEIVKGRAFLRKNVIQGPYQNVNHYLDVQFRLLREDFVGPLREGVANYLSSAPTNHIENVKVHKDVQFLNTETINEFYCVRVQFGSKKKKTYNFENSKRFMFGSLLCFTKDNFKTLIFGKVAQRKIEDLQKGEVIVAFDEKPYIDYKSSYLMAECSVYFEPYFHVLRVLQNMSEENFPMERYIIRVSSSVLPPEYLTSPHCTYEIEGHRFNPLSEWPNEFFYGFNESQMMAFKAAITEEISVIQGPPGTGKTFLGLRVAETLLRNIDCWYDYTPMLVICFTNHALDQFLEELIEITNGNIVRVGGQSKNTNLDSYNLRNKTERDEAVAAKRREVQNCLREIKRITENLQQISYYNSVLSFRNFREVIPEIKDSWFATPRDKSIIDWLLEGANYGYMAPRQSNLEMIRQQQEFNRIGINDDIEAEEEQMIFDATNEFNEHILPNNFDRIFEEVLNSSMARGSFSMLTLSSMRDQLKRLENTYLQLQEVQNPSFHQQLREEEIYIEMEELRQQYEYLKQNLSEGRVLQDVEKPNSTNFWNPYEMPFQDRWRLYFYFLSVYRKRESDVLRMTSEDFPAAYKQYEEMRQIEDVRAMKNALVVGMTTTSAARLRNSLQTLKNPIVIVEEAAEVLEAHIVTSITKHCKHLILIGDHKQLKPSTANYSIEKQYKLGISLFERMIKNDIHCHTLNIQHRMRPEIASLIRPAIYDFLEDHPSVLRRPAITGVDNSVFFIDHDNPEEECDGSSKTNLHEVTFLIYLARHLVLNGYNPENITILAAYLGQFFAFQREKKAHADLLQGMRVAVLDNYQGEEADIILLSLVRNNNENKIGFLAIENRVCVALSRARNGMFIMGNMTQLCSDNKLWRKIKTSLENLKALGPELPLRCQIHQDQLTPVKSSVDFYSVSEGGCSKKCDMDLRCGHKCSYLCHIRDQSHSMYKCQAECNKQLCKKDETHVCKKLCYEECGPCSYLVERTLACGHEVKIECHIVPETYKCQVLVNTKLPCGHITDKPCCADTETYRCPHICDVQVQPCGHACELSCHIRKDPDHQEYACRKPCAKFMKDCTTQKDDHMCKKQCYQECDPCTITVRKRRTLCQHLYDVLCNYDVDELVCEKPCAKKLKCGHPCRSRCNMPCTECQEKVSKVNPSCGHSVKVRCCQPPSRKFCNKKCPLTLPCGHLCTKKCNEPCTTVCTVLVDSAGITAECGHFVTRIECHMARSCVDPKLLVKYCNAPCGKKLKCDHLCSGSCGECLQGRVHKRCSEKCGARLVCDHPCGFSCRQACRPCKRVCLYKCRHSVCHKKCGEVCTPCTEPCTRRCVHQWCTRLCGAICNVPPCMEPCQKILKCGHQCIGFCGDPCPSKCLVCDRDELLEPFFGSETEDARYVLLNDCNHIVENDGMEYWLQQNESQISYKLCPRCKTGIKSTQRYSDYIKKAISDVAQVKIKANGRPEEIEEMRREINYISRNLLSRSGTLIMYCSSLGDLLNHIKRRVQNSKRGRTHINIYEVRSLKAKLQIIDDVIAVCCHEKVVVHTPKEIFFPQVNLIMNVLSRDNFDDYISNQEIDDLSSEVDRLSRIVDLSCIKNVQSFEYHYTKEVVKNLTTNIEKQIFGCLKFSKEMNDFLKEQLRELNDAVKSGIAISDREKHEILQAMGFTKGHWFKCPNGHVYAIGECGGAMEEGNCNECGAKIGGRSHRLLDDNAVATEMDGAAHGAWSVAVNLLNYDLP